MRTPGPAIGRKTAQPRNTAARQLFAALLAKHLREGTRQGSSREPWTFAAFAGNVPSSRDHGGEYVSPRSVSNWCKATALPDEIEPILRALFGPSDRHAAAREELREAFIRARNEKIAETTARARRDPAGSPAVIRPVATPSDPEDTERIDLDESGRPTDQRAASEATRRQLQSAIADTAAELAETAGRRLDNSRLWRRLPAVAASLQALAAGDPRQLIARLGDAYGLMLRLGRFLESDDRVRDDRMADDGPLDTDLHGLLTDLVRLAAPWLRGFPTIARCDDEAGKALQRAAEYRRLLGPARVYVEAAYREKAVTDRAATGIALLAEAAGDAGAADFLGQKAGNRLVGNARNLMLAAAELYAAAMAGAVPQSRLALARRAGASLAAAGDAVERFAEAAPPDLARALRTLATEGGRLRTPRPRPSPPWTRSRCRRMSRSALGT